MAYSLPPLGYSFDALEPHIDAKTMEIHYTKHHQKYIDDLTATLKDYPQLSELPVNDLLAMFDALPQEVKKGVRNFGGGHSNHTFFWQCMTKNSSEKPHGMLADAIVKQYGSFEDFQTLFDTNARTVFGSGWSWLSVTTRGELVATATPNQDSPILEGLLPVIGLDVWEHAYYLKYTNRRPEYISAWWNVVNWEFAEENYRKALK